MRPSGTPVRGTLLMIALVFLAVIVVWPFDAAAGQMYWTDFIGGTIERANLDGTDRVTLVTGLTNPHGIALDLANNHMYWAEYGGHSIRRANLDGTNVVNIVTGLSGAPAGLAIDFSNRRLYWTDADIRFSAIRRANLDGSGMQTVVNTSSPRDIFLTTTRMYWTDWYTGTLESAKLDGTDRRVLRTDLSLPYGLEVDVVHGLLYWADSGSNRIRRANLDGTGAQDVLAATDPVALALDSQAGRLFWDEFGTPPRTIYSANTDGSEKLQLVLDAGSPYDIAVPPRLVLTIATNAATFRAGDSVIISVGVDNPGLVATMDFYFGALLPDGDTIVFFTDLAFNSGVGRLSNPATLRPIVAGVNLTAPFTFHEAAFFTYPWKGTEPPGSYVLFLAAVRPGALVDNVISPGDIVVLATSVVTFITPPCFPCDRGASASRGQPVPSAH